MQDLTIDRWEEFLKKYYWEDIIEMSNSYPERRSLLVRFSDIDVYDQNLANMLLEEPDIALENATQILREIDIPTGVTLDEAHLRIIKLPRKVKIKNIRSEDIGKLVSIDGLVSKATEVRPRIVKAKFECPFCHHAFDVEQDERKFKEPVECEKESGGCGKRAQFKLLVEQCKFVNAQKIRLQESPEELRGGELPQTIDVNLEEDLSGVLSPGDRVIITGILRSYQRATQFGKMPFFDIYLDGISLEKKEEEFEEIEITEKDEKRIMELRDQPDVYEKLIKSIASTIYGYEEIKEAMVLQLFSGIPKDLPDETRIRGDIHLLLVGDPGVAKSQLLNYLVKLAPRGLYTGGKSSTSAGLTATAVKDEFGGGRWTLEGGALVLADKGIAAVDEIDKMKREDREALHEAMEQQTVSIAKAGIMARLNSRCALLAAANPQYGRFDRYTPIAEQINMPSTLLSRFDLIFTMMDRPNEEMDMKTAKHIIETLYAGELLSANTESIREAEEEVLSPLKDKLTIKPEISPELIRKYVAWSKRNVFPVMTEEAKEKFLDFYIKLRSQGYDEDAPVPTTARQLEALVRLGEARARARLSDKITLEDAERAINIVTYCLNRVFVDPETGKMDVDWVAVGTTKSKRDRVRMIKDIIKELEKEHGEAVAREEALEVAEERGIEREKAEEIIDKLERDGELFFPQIGFVSFVRQRG